MSADDQTPTSTRATEVTGGVPIGVRFEFFGPDGHTCLGAVIREDIRAAAAPRIGERFGRGTFDTAVHGLVGLDAEVHQVDHYVSVPGARERSALVMAVVRLTHVTPSELRTVAPLLKEQGWSVNLF
ncbi:hypothetical protein [Plantibacter sp. CFBP 8775]|uniref:hypothetical protein n=1 Tax=Plantibacter sp. CFBP 8775 TaxID=2774038 RepID=UPI0017863358|nr:hypothetical protein [Plantibacter sp. CFBP 8775]MBD8104733.1 hypothetical protein [Plantibacter sp. CFBP 8775]